MTSEPVDAHQAPSANRFLEIEKHGIEPIPAAERQGSARDLGFIWAGAFVNYASLLTASLATNFFGLGVWDGLAAVALGSVAGAVVLGLLSHTGARTGLPQVAVTEHIFSPAGAKVAAFLTLFLAVGWFAVDTVIAAQAGVQLLSLGGLGDRARQFALPIMLVVAGVSVAVAVYGHATIRVLEKFGAVAFAALAALLFLFLAPQFQWTLGPTAAGPRYPGAFVLGFMTCFALVASWFPFASDYSRYLPADTRSRDLTLWPALGIVVPMLLLGLFGLLLPTIDPRLAADPAGGPLAVVTAHSPVWVAVPFLLFVIVGEILANYLDVYTAGLVTLTLGIRLQRWQTALGCGVLGALLAGYAVVIQDFHVAYEQFLLVTYLWAPAWAGIVLLAFFSGRRLHPAAALAAWGLGTVVSLFFVNYPVIFPNLGAAFNQPLIDQLHGADLSGLVSLAVALLTYAAAMRITGAPLRRSA